MEEPIKLNKIIKSNSLQINEPPRSSRNSDTTSRSSMSDQQISNNNISSLKKRLKQDFSEYNHTSNSSNINDVSSKYAINLKRKAIINQSILIDKSVKINSKLRLNRNPSHEISTRQKLVNRSSSSLDRHNDNNGSLYDKVMSNVKMTQNSDATTKYNNINENKLSEHIHQMSALSLPTKQQAIEQENNSDVIHNEKLATAVYKMLLQLEIKFPGKTTQQAKNFLNEVFIDSPFYLSCL